MATIYGKLGEIYYTRRDLDQAEDMFKKSLEVEETPDNKGVMATAYGYLGDICRLKNNLNQAEDMYNKGLNLFEAIGSERMIEIMRTMLTNLKMKKKQG
jgi:tetratricopeptide (TPR) repeat protein